MSPTTTAATRRLRRRGGEGREGRAGVRPRQLQRGIRPHDARSCRATRTRSSLPSAAANPNTVVVLETGAPALMPWKPKVAGVLEAWYPRGARGGAAIASLLYGDVDPSGKLPQTWPRTDKQVPAPHHGAVPGRERHVQLLRGRRRRLPLVRRARQVAAVPVRLRAVLHEVLGAPPRARPDLRDVGAGRAGHRRGDQHRRRPPDRTPCSSTSPNRTRWPRRRRASSPRSPRSALEPGQTKKVRLDVDARELSYWDSGAQAFTVQDGKYTFAAGDSSRSLPATAGYRVTPQRRARPAVRDTGLEHGGGGRGGLGEHDGAQPVRLHRSPRENLGHGAKGLDGGRRHPEDQDAGSRPRGARRLPGRGPRLGPGRTVRDRRAVHRSRARAARHQRPAARGHRPVRLAGGPPTTRWG